MPSAYTPPLRTPVRRIGGQRFDFSTQILVMGIVNRTPDSFYDRGRTFGFEEAVAAALAATKAGADLIDIGGVPFSADVPQVSVAEEMDRVVPVVAEIARRAPVVVSVDTGRAKVAASCLAAGASVINDTSGRHDPALAEVVAGTGATLIIAHSLAGPGRHVSGPAYTDVVREVRNSLAARIELAVDSGIGEEQIILDPGHDLNKNTLHSLELTRRLSEIADLGLPVLAAVSNKDFVAEVIGLDVEPPTGGSIAAAAACIFQGARLIRMHDVAQSVAARDVLEAILAMRQPAVLRHNVI